MRKRSIQRSVLTTTIIIISMLSIFLVSIMIYYMNLITEKSIGSSLKPLAKTAAQNVESNLHILVDRIMLIASDNEFKNPETNIENIENVLNKAASGIEFVWIALYNNEGKLITGGENSPISIEQWEMKGLMDRTKNLVINDVINTDKISELPVGMPITADGKVRYYLVGSYKYDVLNDVLSNINLSANSTAFILNQNGELIAHKERGNMSNAQSFFAKLGKKEETDKLISKWLSGKTGSNIEKISNSSTFFSYSPIPGVNWTIIISAPKNDFMVETRTAMIISVLVAIIMLAFAVLLINFIIRKRIFKPLSNLATSATKLAKGDMNETLASNSSDEIGLLYQDFACVQKSIQNLIFAMKEMAEKQGRGELSARMNDENFDGAYKEVAREVNNMMQENVYVINEIMECMKKFSEGDFSVEFKELPGEQINITKTIHLLKTNLHHIMQEIDNLASSAAKGNLQTRADVKQYKGDWQKLLIHLNDLVEAVDKPISEASNVLNQMASGNLHINISGQYEGDFAIMKTSINGVIREVLSYISEISLILAHIAEKDLTHYITREYLGDFNQIKISINSIVKSLNAFIFEIQGVANQVNIGSSQISNANSLLAEGVNHQANSVKSLNNSIKSIDTRSNESAKHSQEIEVLSVKSKDNALVGTTEMDKMQHAMDEIKKSSENIVSIMKVIEDISFQTNILALNASIEAARAGSNGKGFAVVANEVRDLARRSQDATTQTQLLMEESMKRVLEGMSFAKSTSSALSTVVDNINDMASYMANIATLSSDTAASVSTVTLDINQISNIVESNSATSHENAATSQELSNQSEVLLELVSSFVLAKKEHDQK